jgi:hypothetical protein
VLGWQALAEETARQAKAGGFRAVATDRRPLAAELAYYLREHDLPVVSLRGDSPPRDHFEMTRPLTPSTPRPVLLVSFSAAKADAEPVATADIAAGQDHRTVYFHRLHDEMP